jgi:hypothetical protein
MSEDGVPFLAKKVAPPARMDCPPISLLKKERVGIVPSALSRRAKWRGMRESRDVK